MAGSSFPIKPEDLIERAKEILIEQSLDFLSNPETVDTKMFVFKSPVMGPLTYAELRRIYTSFSLPEAFPGFFPCYHNFWVDPYEPSRVWFTVRSLLFIFHTSKGNDDACRSYMKNTGPLLGHSPTNKACMAREITFGTGISVLDSGRDALHALFGVQCRRKDRQGHCWLSNGQSLALKGLLRR